MLDELGITYEQQVTINYFVADFVIPDKMLVIECNGCYWHGCQRCGYTGPDGRNKGREHAIRKRSLTEAGYTIKVFWEHEFKMKTVRDAPTLIF